MRTALATLVITVAAVVVPLGGGSTAWASGFSMTPGDLILSLGSSDSVVEVTPSGSFVQTLVSSADGLQYPTGSAFDGQGNLFVTDFMGSQILRVDHATGAVTVFSTDATLNDGTSYNSPESIAFSNGYSAMYVSDANRLGTGGGIHVVNPTTGAGEGFLPIPSSNGSDGAGESDWLAFNQAGSLFMTNENSTQGVMQVDLGTGDIVSPSFVPNLPGSSPYAISFDKNGNLWVGDTDSIGEYDTSGNLVQTITNPSFSTIFAAVFNPTGDTLYAGDIVAGDVWAYALNGTQVGHFSTGDLVTGLSVVGSVIAPGAPEGVVTPSSHDYGSVDLGSSSSAQTFTVTSTGTSALAITSVGLAGADPSDYSISNDTCTGASLDPTQTCTVDVTFSPTTAGTRTATLDVNDNASDSPQTAALTGIGLQVAVPTTLSVNAATGDFADATTVSATLTDSSTSAPISGVPVTLTLGGAESCSATTDVTGTASCSITPGEAAGTYTLAGSFAGDTTHATSSGSAAFVVTTEETALSYTGDTSALDGSSMTLSGTLTTDDPSAGTALAGKSVTFTLGSGGTAQTCSGTTDASGSASCTISSVNQAVGAEPVAASFAGDSYYRSASASSSADVFPSTGLGAFVIGDVSAGAPTSGTGVYFWGSQWASHNSLSGGAAPSAMKGFADSPTPGLTCGATFTTRTGDSAAPPSSLPGTIAVIVSSKVTQKGATIRGTIAHIVIVQVDPGYGDAPGHLGTGTIVGVVC